MRIIDEDTYEEQEFTCPVCGSHSFGTIDTGSRKDNRLFSKMATGHCHGVKCTGFQWLRSEDATVMRGTGVIRPRRVTLKNVHCFESSQHDY